MSARAALDGGDPGFAAFAADFTAYLASQGRSDLRVSAIAQARRIAGSLLDEVAVTRRAAEMRAGDAAGRVRQFSERLAEVAVHGRDAVTVVTGESGRLLFALNDAAEADSARLGREVGGQLDALFDGELRDAAAAEIERRGRDRLAPFAVAAAEAWRQRRREAIEQGLAAVDARLAKARSLLVARGLPTCRGMSRRAAPGRPGRTGNLAGSRDRETAGRLIENAAIG